METHQSLPYLRETLLFLALTGILIPLLRQRRVNQVLGFLAVGALVGPYGLALWVDRYPWLAAFTFPRREGVLVLGELGVLFLMFTIGLELSAARLWALRRWVFGAGSVQVCVSAALIGALVWLFGNRIEAAAVLGLVLSLSSTAMVMQLMTEQRMLGSALGQAGFSVLMLQDLAVVPLLILIGVLAGGSSAGWPTLAGFTLLKSATVIVLIYLLGRRVIQPLFRAFCGRQHPEVLMALTLLSTLGIGALTAAAGLSMALGAFLAGLLLAETEFRHEVEVTVEPFKGLLMGLFFMTVGMAIDVREIARSPLWLPLSVLGLFMIKSAVLAVIFRGGGFNWGRALEGALLLGQGGEFTFIVVGYAMERGLLASDAGQFVMLVVSLSLFATPPLARAGRLFGDWWERRHAADDGDAGAAPETAEGLVIIAGFGRVGQLVAHMLEAQGIRYVALESNAQLVGSLRARGIPIYFGDAARIELLRKVQADRAAAIVLTMDHPASALDAVRAVRREYPALPLFARANDERHAQQLKRAGASAVIPETLESGLQLAASVLRQLDVTDGAVGQLVQQERERRIGKLRDAGESSPAHAGK